LLELAQDVDERERKGATLGKRIKRSPSAKLGGNNATEEPIAHATRRGGFERIHFQSDFSNADALRTWFLM